jgi:hypothetical protein
MTYMNWEKNRECLHGAANAYDELPPAGSYRDQRRWFAQNSGNGEGKGVPMYPAKATQRKRKYW